ncbi:MAG: methylated-DNA--[protein]-cysteine S-methyltransferase [Candidatus Omnitrophica bacterium]|nr:methylated-DNA--[protein]-cysteine S-methyltransferase [Candidatus Omnitrophota bacterium]
MIGWVEVSGSSRPVCRLRWVQGTAFQKRVWQELLKIPFGRTVSYKTIAERIGRPRAVRAVANAIGQNPLPILVPCHRVVRSDQTLGGYSRGLNHKRWLLEYERKTLYNKGFLCERKTS